MLFPGIVRSDLEYKILGALAIVSFLLLFLSFRQTKTFDRIALILLFLVVTAVLISVLRTKPNRKVTLLCKREGDTKVLYVRGFRNRIHLDAFKTLEEAEKVTPFCVVYDTCCSFTKEKRFFTLTLDSVEASGIPKEATPIGNGDELSEAVYPCVVGNICDV